MDRIPGADTLGFGFDITKRYHESSTTQRIFREGKPKDSEAKVGKTTYAVPQNVAAEAVRTTDGSSQVFSTREQVQEHFSVKAGVTGSGFGFKGHVDASYSHVTNQDKSYFYALVEATNHNYNLKLKEQRTDWFTSDFAADVNSLPNAFTKDSEDLFFAFFGVYGTHYVHQVSLGGSLYYYVAIEKTYSKEETTIKANLDMEYKGVFGKVKADASSSWQSLGKQWASSRVVRLVTQGGDNNLEGLAPGFGDWKGDSFTAWSESLLDKPGLTGFKLRPISDIAPLPKRKAMQDALRAYLRGGIIVKADRDSTPQTARRAFTSYSTIDGPNGTVAPPVEMPLPPRREEEVCGVQLVLFNPDTFDVLLNRVYYKTQSWNHAEVRKIWDEVSADLKNVRANDYFCALSVFGISPLLYPPPEVTAFLGNCGANLTQWQKYVGATGLAGGIMCYTFVGRRGVRGQAKEDFAYIPIESTSSVRKLNATSQYFALGGSVLRAASRS